MSPKKKNKVFGDDMPKILDVIKTINVILKYYKGWHVRCTNCTLSPNKITPELEQDKVEQNPES